MDSLNASLNNLDFYFLYNRFLYNFKAKRHYNLHSVQLKCVNGNRNEDEVK